MRLHKSAKLDSARARLRLARRGKPYWQKLAPFLSLGYRRTRIAGTWIARVGDNDTETRLGTADDFDPSNGSTILSYDEAQEAARKLKNDDNPDSGEMLTVAKAVDNYEDALTERGGDTQNAKVLRSHLSDRLMKKHCALLKAQDFRDLKKDLSDKDLAKASINRIGNSLKAALNLAAEDDKRIYANSYAWKIGYKNIPDMGDKDRGDVILTDTEVMKLNGLAYKKSHAYGVLYEGHAETGARTSQILRIKVRGLDMSDRDSPLIMMPTSRKGRGRKFNGERPLAIPVGLALKLEKMADGRAGNEPLFVEDGGVPWGPKDHYRWFNEIVAAAKLKPREANITIIALRHSSIVRQLNAGVAEFTVAENHDTSVKEIKDHYGKYITSTKKAQDQTRKALLNLGNVVSLAS